MSTAGQSITLYDVEVELQEAYERVCELEQEGKQEELSVALSILETYITESVHKRDRCGKFLETIEANEKAIDAEIDRLKQKKLRAEKVRTSFEGYILMIMDRIHVNRLEGQLFSFIAKKNPPSVVIDDQLKIPAKYLVEPPLPPPKPDKKAIARDIKDGTEVPGAHLAQETRLVVE